VALSWVIEKKQSKLCEDSDKEIELFAKKESLIFVCLL
jgi:hypothetical protein